MNIFYVLVYNNNYIHCKFISLTSMKSTLEGAKLSRLKLCLAYVPEEMVSRYDGDFCWVLQKEDDSPHKRKKYICFVPDCTGT
jgi:hypothetical protein